MEISKSHQIMLFKCTSEVENGKTCSGKASVLLLQNKEMEIDGGISPCM